LSNVGTFLATNPGYAILVTLLVLIVAIISAFFPALWYVIIVAFVAIVCNQAARHLLEIRQRARTGNQA
jgi:uncharacterized membrane protein YoaK (UPF0700 family)